MGARWMWLWMLLGTACVTSPVSPTDPTGPTAGSETHWLGLCDDATGCATGAECVCGICTALCPEDGECSRDGFAGRCASPADVAALCGRPIAPAVCVAECAGDNDCAPEARCADGVCVPRAPVAERRNGLRSERYVAAAEPKIDFLFVVDNSGSMCEEQRALSAAFEALAQDFADVDFRIAVTSTDLQAASRGRFLAEPSPPVAMLNCVDDDGNPRAPDTADCFDFELESVLSAADGLSPAELARRFRCLTTLGTGGDGFEKGLEAMRLALTCDGPNAARFGTCCVDGVYVPGDCSPDFLRPDAELTVVFISDEDDCSDPASNARHSKRAICKYGETDNDGDGVPDGYADPELCVGDPAACFAAECGDLSARHCAVGTCEISRSENSNCAWGRDTLTPVADYVEFLADLKGGADRVAIAAYVGSPAYTSAGDVITYNEGQPPDPRCNPNLADFDPTLTVDECCPGGACQGLIQPSCQSDFGVAFAGHRYLALANAFSARCRPEDGCGVCQGDISLFQPASLIEPLCLQRAPRCSVTVGAGARGCDEAERADAANLQVEVGISCDDADACDAVSSRVLRADEYTLWPNAACAGGWVVVPLVAIGRSETVRITYLPE